MRIVLLPIFGILTLSVAFAAWNELMTRGVLEIDRASLVVVKRIDWKGIVIRHYIRDICIPRGICLMRYSYGLNLEAGAILKSSVLI